MDRVATTDSCFFSFSKWVFYFVTTGLISEIGLCENSINQSINNILPSKGLLTREVMTLKSWTRLSVYI